MTPERRTAGRDLLRSFGRARGGAVAVLFAIMAIPLLLGAGVGVDFARLEILKSSLQSVADGAALAGATVLSQTNGPANAKAVAADYFNKGVATLATTANVTSPIVTTPTSIRVQVTAVATLQMTFMSLLTSAMSVNVLAAAQGPGYFLQVTRNGKANSSAYDSDSIYFYNVSTDGTLPTSNSSNTLLYTNDSSVNAAAASTGNSAQNIALGPNDLVGFALVNVTGGLHAYAPSTPNNAYGGKPKSIHTFYSSITAPSMLAFPSQPAYQQGVVTTSKTGTKTCSPQAITTTSTGASYVPSPGSGSTSSCSTYYPHPCVTAVATVVNGKTTTTYDQNNLLIAGSCSTPSTAVETCLQLYNTPLVMSWNDMGGEASDDFDYNDENYTVTCQPNTGTTATATNPANVSLVQ